jgi:hypothetical protein
MRQTFVASSTKGDDGRALAPVVRIPPRWPTAVVLVLLANVLCMTACIVVGLWKYGDATELFKERKLGTYFTVASLVAAEFTCYGVAWLMRGSRVFRFWLFFGLLLGVAASDDLFRLHERLDEAIHWMMGWDPKDPLTDHLDDVLVLCYALPAVWLAWKYRRPLLQASLMVRTLAAAMALFAGHVALDFLDWSVTVEECVKQTAGCVILLAFLAVAMDRDTQARWKLASGEGPG